MSFKIIEYQFDGCNFAATVSSEANGSTTVNRLDLACCIGLTSNGLEAVVSPEPTDEEDYQAEGLKPQLNLRRTGSCGGTLTTTWAHKETIHIKSHISRWWPFSDIDNEWDFDIKPRLRFGPDGVLGFVHRCVPFCDLGSFLSCLSNIRRTHKKDTGIWRTVADVGRFIAPAVEAANYDPYQDAVKAWCDYFDTRHIRGATIKQFFTRTYVEGDNLIRRADVI